VPASHLRAGGTLASAAIVALLPLVAGCMAKTGTPGDDTNDRGDAQAATDAPVPRDLPDADGPDTSDDGDAGDGDDASDAQDAADSADTSTDFRSFDCGVAPVEGQEAGAAYVTDAGVVTFLNVPPGSHEDFFVAVQDSSDVSETITGATLTGTGAAAFQVLALWPIPVPAGQQASVPVRFTPPALGTYSAQLILQTANMGPSPVALAGTSAY
jgi:hypothetical protein